MNEQEQREAEEAVVKEIEAELFKTHGALYGDIAKAAAVRRELKLRAYQRAEEELETSRVEEVNAERECMEEGDVDGAMIRARKVNMILRCQNIIRKHLKAIQ